MRSALLVAVLFVTSMANATATVKVWDRSQSPNVNQADGSVIDYGDSDSLVEFASVINAQHEVSTAEFWDKNPKVILLRGSNPNEVVLRNPHGLHKRVLTNYSAGIAVEFKTIEGARDFKEKFLKSQWLFWSKIPYIYVDSSHCGLTEEKQEYSPTSQFKGGSEYITRHLHCNAPALTYGIYE